MKLVLLLTLATLFRPSATQAAWWLSQLHVSTKEDKISDEPIEFTLGDMQCGVTKTEFNRLPDGSVTEDRILYCQTAKDTQVSVIANCEYPNYSMQGLTIHKGSAYYYPALTCGPEKRSP